MLRIGLLQCDGLDAHHAAIDGDYDALVSRLVARDDIEVVAHRVDLGMLPTAITEFDGWIVSGSRHGVDDGLAWVDELCTFVGRAIGRDRPVVGICFGHQVIARALDAPVGRAGSGWSIGAVDYELCATAPDDEDSSRRFSLIASHQDQVHALPDGAVLLATSDRCPIAGFTVDDHVLTVQGHPEFTPALAESLYRARAGTIDANEVDRAIASLDAPLANERVGRWILDVLDR